MVKHSLFSSIFKRVMVRIMLVLWVGVYIAGNVEFSALHDLSHSHEKVSHSEQQEQDSCHRAIYHHEVEKGCGHKSHIVVKSSCDFCDVIASSYQELLTATVNVSSSGQPVHQSFFTVSDFSIALVNKPSRGPPVGII